MRNSNNILSILTENMKIHIRMNLMLLYQISSYVLMMH